MNKNHKYKDSYFGELDGETWLAQKELEEKEMGEKYARTWARYKAIEKRDRKEIIILALLFMYRIER